MTLISTIYNLFWGDLFTIPLPGGSSIGISLLVLILIPAGIFFTLCTRFLPIRLFPEAKLSGLEGMPLLQAAMGRHFGYAGVIFTAVTLWLICFSLDDDPCSGYYIFN